MNHLLGHLVSDVHSDLEDSQGHWNPYVIEFRTRGHNLRIKGRAFRMEMRRNEFSQRVVRKANARLVLMSRVL